VLVAGLFTLWQRWKNPIPGYHDIPPGRRAAIGAAYVLLVLGLAASLPGSEEAWHGLTSV
jgi:hypothetical protein